eukprot:4654924-Prorocentrum_lima.AAC.1
MDDSLRRLKCPNIHNTPHKQHPQQQQPRDRNNSRGLRSQAAINKRRENRNMRKKLGRRNNRQVDEGPRAQEPTR